MSCEGASQEPRRTNITFSHAFAAPAFGTLDNTYKIQSKDVCGEGAFGHVVVGRKKATGQKYAIKVMEKSKIRNEERFNLEVGIQQQLDHPNIVKLFEVFTDFKKVYLVLELCTGGELFDRIVQQVEQQGYPFGEQDCAAHMQQIMRALKYLRCHNIVHRDIKPENFLLQHKAKDAEIKIIDFGLARMYKQGDPLMTTKAGTPFYIAPQVLLGAYDEKCDIWSCGVIMYILLCGYPPFTGDNDEDILMSVAKGQYEFMDSDWENITDSGGAKELIRQMLNPAPELRPSAEQILQHSWFECIDAPPVFEPLKGISKRLRRFNATARLKKIALTMIARQIQDKDIETLKTAFQALDTDQRGELTTKEFMDGMREQTSLELSDELLELADALDTDKSGMIDYSEFLAATLSQQLYTKQEVMWQCFRLFDADGDGKITKEELARMIAGKQEGEFELDVSLSEELIAEADFDGDGKLNFEEFVKMMNE